MNNLIFLFTSVFRHPTKRYILNYLNEGTILLNEQLLATETDANQMAQHVWVEGEMHFHLTLPDHHFPLSIYVSWCIMCTPIFLNSNLDNHVCGIIRKYDMLVSWDKRNPLMSLTKLRLKSWFPPSCPVFRAGLGGSTASLSVFEYATVSSILTEVGVSFRAKKKSRVFIAMYGPWSGVVDTMLSVHKSTLTTKTNNGWSGRIPRSSSPGVGKWSVTPDIF